MPWRPLLPARRSTPRGCVYVLHFSRPFGHARHYIGFTRRSTEAEPLERVVEHLTGRGARLLRYAVNAGIGVTLGLVKANVSQVEEYRLKNRGGAGRVCQCCRAMQFEQPSLPLRGAGRGRGRRIR